MTMIDEKLSAVDVSNEELSLADTEDVDQELVTTMKMKRTVLLG